MSGWSSLMPACWIENRLRRFSACQAGCTVLKRFSPHCHVEKQCAFGKVLSRHFCKLFDSSLFSDAAPPRRVSAVN
jgi:hypothetical protein